MIQETLVQDQPQDSNGNYMLSSSGQQAACDSWHYTVGNDGIFKHMDEDQVAWHAG